MSDTLVKVENVSKKFCRSLKRSLWYGMQDIGAELLGRNHSQNGLPPLRPDEFWAVQDINFELKRGDCLGLIGRNGAGKSTLLKMLNGLLKPDTGRIEMRGRIGALIELGTGFNPILTGRENVYVNGSVLGFSKKEIDRKFEAIMEFAEIGDFIDMPVKNYSSGMKVRLGFAVAAQMEPDVLLIDEVLAVGDVGFKIKCYNAITELVQNAAVIFVSHSMPQIARVCNRAILLKNGQITHNANNKLDTVIKNYYDGFDLAEPSQQIMGGCSIENIILNDVSTASSAAVEVEHGSKLTIDLEISSTTYYASVYLVIGFTDLDQKSVAVHVTDHTEVVEGCTQMRVCLPDFCLTNGKYSISYGLANSLHEGSRREIICHYRHWNSILVTGTKVEGSTPVLLPGTVATAIRADQ